MKIKKSYLLAIAVTAVVSVFASAFYLRAIGEPKDKAILFATLGIDRAMLVNELSAYDVERASEHFANVILGWTMDPAFSAEASTLLGDATYTGQRQEKENLIFIVSGYFDSAKPAEDFLNLLNTKLVDYNNSTNAPYVLTNTSTTFIDGQRSDLRIVIGVFLLSLIAICSILVFKDYAFYAARD